MTIDPKTSMYVNLALAIIMAIGSGTLGLPPGVSPDVAKGIMAWCAWISVVANFIMHGLSSSTAGPAVSPSKEN